LQALPFPPAASIIYLCPAFPVKEEYGIDLIFIDCGFGNG